MTSDVVEKKPVRARSGEHPVDTISTDRLSELRSGRFMIENKNLLMTRL